MSAFLHQDGWAGHGKTPVEIVGETRTRLRVKLLADTRLPGRNRMGASGDEILVPKYAVSVGHST